MLSKQTLDTINAQIRCEDFLKRSKNGGYICPYCGAGAKPQKIRPFMVFQKRNEFFCTHCGAAGNALDLYRRQTGTDLPTAARQMALALGIPINPDLPSFLAEESEREKENNDKGISSVESQHHYQHEGSGDESAGAGGPDRHQPTDLIKENERQAIL